MDKLHKWGGKPYLAYKFFFDLIMRQMVESVNPHSNLPDLFILTPIYQICFASRRFYFAFHTLSQSTKSHRFDSSETRS